MGEQCLSEKKKILLEINMLEKVMESTYQAKENFMWNSNS